MLEIRSIQSVTYTTTDTGGRMGFCATDKALLETNPKREIGKYGIRYHTYADSFFYDTITVETVEAHSLAKKTYYLNKASTIQWLNSQLVEHKKVSLASSKNEIVAKINKLSSTLLKTKNKHLEFVQKKYEQGETDIYLPTLNTRGLNLFDDRNKAQNWFNFIKMCSSSWGMMKFRFFLQLDEKTIETASKILAVEAYHQALCVPAYSAMMENYAQVQTFDALPITSKDNYIKPALHGAEKTLYRDGKIPGQVKRDTSTGTSGQPTPWYRGIVEQKHVEKLTMFAAKAVLGDTPFSFINGFAMGPWATGVTATSAMMNNSQASVAVIGPNIEGIYACIKEQIELFGNNHPIVIAGYPPHIRAVVEKAVDEGFPLHDYTVIAVVGGESMSEVTRDLLVVQKNDKNEVIRTGLKQCYSSYGASDLDINIGYESDFEIELRKLCHRPENASLAEDLFGKNEFIPMIFHYDPFNYYIESDASRNLLYTCVRGDRISPRVRYNLGDIGKTMPVSELMATLTKHGIELKNPPRTNLPLLFIWGRQEAQISFRAAKIAPETLGEMIFKLDANECPGLKALVNHFGFYQYEKRGKTFTEIHLEFKKDFDFSRIDSKFVELMIKKLSELNVDFGAQIAACPEEELPAVRLFKQDESPMAIQQKKYEHRKKQYIFKAGDEFIPSHKALQKQGLRVTVKNSV